MIILQIIKITIKQFLVKTAVWYWIMSFSSKTGSLDRTCNKFSTDMQQILRLFTCSPAYLVRLISLFILSFFRVRHIHPWAKLFVGQISCLIFAMRIAKSLTTFYILWYHQKKSLIHFWELLCAQRSFLTPNSYFYSMQIKYFRPPVTGRQVTYSCSDVCVRVSGIKS